MTQADLPTTISSDGDHTTTTISGDGDHTTTTITTTNSTTIVGPTAVEDEDIPAESFLLPVEAELDWVDRNAAAATFDRDDSTKGTTNPKSQSKPPQPQITTTSQRFSVNLQSLGVQNAGGRKASRQSNSGNFFPKKKSDVSGASEPSSPKVSCMGRVRSKGSGQSSSAVGFWSCCKGSHAVDGSGGAVTTAAAE